MEGAEVVWKERRCKGPVNTTARRARACSIQAPGGEGDMGLDGPDGRMVRVFERFAETYLQCGEFWGDCKDRAHTAVLARFPTATKCADHHCMSSARP